MSDSPTNLTAEGMKAAIDARDRASQESLDALRVSRRLGKHHARHFKGQEGRYFVEDARGSLLRDHDLRLELPGAPQMATLGEVVAWLDKADAELKALRKAKRALRSAMANIRISGRGGAA